MNPLQGRTSKPIFLSHTEVHGTDDGAGGSSITWSDCTGAPCLLVPRVIALSPFPQEVPNSDSPLPRKRACGPATLTPASGSAGTCICPLPLRSPRQRASLCIYMSASAAEWTEPLWEVRGRTERPVLGPVSAHEPVESDY